MQELTAAIGGGWYDWWRVRVPLLRRSGVWPTKASTSIEHLRQRWAGGRSGAPRYSRLLELGSSEQSSVWAAVARNGDDICQMVVLKGVGAQRGSDGEATQRLLDEARLTARMNHPNVVAMQGLLREGTQPVIVMEYLAGQSLATLLASANDLKEFTLELRIGIVARLLRGLDYVHRLRDFDGRPLRVVHGAVSPENVIVTYDGEVKLIDFGRARVRASAFDDPFARRRLPYAPPEQFSSTPDLRGDIFSVGVILWELVANRPLWGRIPTPTLVRRLLAGDIPRLRDVVPGVDGELDRICARALAPHPDGRFRSAADLRGELEHFLTVRQAYVADTAVGALVCNACRELRRVAQKTIDGRIGELGLSLPPARLPAPPAIALRRSGALERRQRTLAASIVAAAVLVAALLWTTLRREPSPATGANAAVASPGVEVLTGAGASGDEVVARDASRLVRLDLSVRPAHAILSIDGRRLSSNPLRATMVWDPHVHTVRAEADGYEPFTTTFRLDADVTLDTALRPKPSGAVLRRERSADERVVLRQRDELHARRRR
jgi:eukaryotic-like serine/threonine-protein kinase